MRWLRSPFEHGAKPPDQGLRLLQERFADFLALLERNHQVLKIIGDMEEKAQGEHLFDANYLRASVSAIRAGVVALIEHMVALGGPEYEGLRDRYRAIDADLEALLQGRRPIVPDAYTVRLDALGRDRAFSVGAKSAHLGEMKARLGLPAPDGFAITAWAYKRFVDANDLQARITQQITSLDIRRYEDLQRVSHEIRALIAASPVPADVIEAIERSYADLLARSGAIGVSIRSSAIGEDTLFSFAGQYSSFLNVRPDQLVDRYREVLASKFTPQAIYYFLSHALSESELAMSVSCVAMVDAVASGVVYTRDPVRPGDDAVLVSAIYGLGKYLVDGTLTPDLFRVSRQDGTVLASQVVRKPVRLVMHPERGTEEEAVPPGEQTWPAIGARELQTLTRYAVMVEAHFGGPQDIEWAIDRTGRISLLQARPLRVVPPRAAVAPPDLSSAEAISRGGLTVSPGAGGGPVCHVASTRDLADVPRGAVVVAPSPFPALVTLLDRIHALVTRSGGVASHLATLAREHGLPMLAGVEDVAAIPPGTVVTVDATEAVIYRGLIPELPEARRPESELFEDTAIFGLLHRVLARIAPLNLLHPSDPGFVIENCQTLHDITRFAHQRAMEEMFSTAKTVEHKARLGQKLKSTIPLDVFVLCLDREPSDPDSRRTIAEEDIQSVPMRAFWGGVRKEGWVSTGPAANTGGLMSVLSTHLSTTGLAEFSECSFAILSREYMVLSLRMGYHFATIEAMCTTDASRNYVRMQHKGGGASLDRRIRRIALLSDLMSRLGFECTANGDFLDCAVSYLDAGAIIDTLERMGRITMLTKQLDMALSNDAIQRWYTEDFAKKIGVSSPGPGSGR